MLSLQPFGSIANSWRLHLTARPEWSGELPASGYRVGVLIFCSGINVPTTGNTIQAFQSAAMSSSGNPGVSRLLYLLLGSSN